METTEREVEECIEEARRRLVLVPTSAKKTLERAGEQLDQVAETLRAIARELEEGGR